MNRTDRGMPICGVHEPDLEPECHVKCSTSSAVPPPGIEPGNDLYRRLPGLCCIVTSHHFFFYFRPVRLYPLNQPSPRLRVFSMDLVSFEGGPNKQRKATSQSVYVLVNMWGWL